MNLHPGSEFNQRDEPIELRLQTEKDLQFIRWLWSDPETMKPVGGPVHLTGEQAQDWFAEMIKPGSSTNCYRLIFNEINEPVGEISFHRLNSVSMTAEFNIKIASRNRGRGYAKKAMIQFLDHFFNHLGGNIMVDAVALDNHRGQRMLLNFGFEHDPNFENVFRLFLTRQRFNSLYGFQFLPEENTAG
jgi:RimJ/RimL family protein N-acetyltransferase